MNRFYDWPGNTILVQVIEGRSYICDDMEMREFIRWYRAVHKSIPIIVSASIIDPDTIDELVDMGVKLVEN